MHYTYKTGGTCSTMIDFDIIDGKLHNIVFTNGCNGNLKGIASLVKGMKLEDVIERLNGISCGNKPTSCPDQIASGLKKFLEENK